VPGGEERKLVTVLFADVMSSATMGEQLDPERMREVMDTFFSAMREEIEAEGGTVEKFIGDAVMAAFGVPTSHEDDPSRALRAATRMLRRIADVNDSLEASHGIALKIRIGVNTGWVLALTMPKPGEAMVTGDAVNAAARLQGIAEPNAIAVGERTARSVRGFRFEDLGEVELRGKAMPVRAFRVLGTTALAPDRGLPGLRAPMVGRDSELAVLASIFDRTSAEGRPNLVTIYGDPGVGKSRLTQEFLSRVEDRRPAPTLVRGRCLPYGEGVTYWPLAEILKSVASVLDSDPPDLVLEKIRKAGADILARATPEPERATAALAYTVGVQDPEHDFSYMEPREVRAETHAAWVLFFSSLGDERVAVAVVEDIHWADPELLDLLEELAERAQGAVLFLCPARPELATRRPDWGGGRRNFSAIALDPLTGDEAESLIELLLDIDELPPSVHMKILDRAEGNPFFLEEIIRHLIDEGRVVHEGGRWRAASGIGEVVIPDNVQAVLAARMDLLDGPDKRVLQAAAVVGRVFWPGPVQELLETDEIDEALRELERRDLVQSRLTSSIAGEPEFIFKHVLTRDVAYESLPRKARRGSHASVARWIERTAGERAREFLELLAYHYSTAVSADPEPDEELRRKAFNYLLRSSDDARSKQVVKKAQRLADEGLALASDDLERTRALELLGLACFTDYQGDLAYRYFKEAALTRAATEPADPEKVAYLCARACDMPSRWPGSMRHIPGPEEVHALLELGLANLPPGDSEVAVRLQCIRASTPFAFPQLELAKEEMAQCERAGLEAAEMALRMQRPDLASGAFDAAGGYATSQGLYARALKIHARRAELLPRLHDPFEIGDLYAMGAWGTFELARYDESLRWAEKGLSVVRGQSPSTQIHLEAWLATALYRTGDWDGSLEAFARVQALLDERRDSPPYFATNAYAAAALIALSRGDEVESDRLQDLMSSMETGASPRLFPWLVRYLVERGDLEGSRRLLDNPPVAWRVHAAEVYEARLEFASAAETWDDVRGLVAEAVGYATEAKAQAVPLFARRLEGRAALASGELDDAVELLASATSGFQGRRAPWEAARTNVDLARALSLSARTDEARATLDAAEEIFAALRATRDITRAREVRRQL
jgi:class 3 adenylate cyclase/tetratricopeptide (TPR) repeat protein